MTTATTGSNKLVYERGYHLRGKVKWWHSEKGYGFLRCQSPDNPEVTLEVFVHYKDVKTQGRRDLIDGQEVEFEIVSAPKGPRAQNVRPVESAD